MPAILLTTLNARYIHASLGLRYLHANLGHLKEKCTLVEFTINQKPDDIAEQLLSSNPEVIGFGVYIWNCTETLQVIRLIKALSPTTHIIVGGPEVSYETTSQALFKHADHVITGQADIAFKECCEELLTGQTPPKLVSPLPIDLATLASPYCEYTEDDIHNRVLYVEASRGCPFKCEFCLSSLDKTAVAFDLDAFLDDLKKLLNRGAKQFKFVDRTFNLKVESSCRILDFFLNEINNGHSDLFLHFELIPDRLPDAIKERLPKFPKACLQFEIGIQTFNQDVQKRISRKQNHAKTTENLIWLRENTSAHIHADLIFGLPGETLQSFGNGFDELLTLQPQEIQVGILKRLRGTPIARHTSDYGMIYMDEPPYRILANNDVDFSTVQRMVRFARYWDLIANSGRFPNSLPILLHTEPFSRFLRASDWLYAKTEQTHAIALQRLISLMHALLVEEFDIEEQTAVNIATADFEHNKLKGRPSFKSYNGSKEETTSLQVNTNNKPHTTGQHAVASRQARHLAQTN